MVEVHGQRRRARTLAERLPEPGVAGELADGAGDLARRARLDEQAVLAIAEDLRDLPDIAEALSWVANVLVVELQMLFVEGGAAR